MAWYTAGSGATCVAAYNPVGASSLANSYVNLINPGTNDAAPGTAPTWAHGTGWTFNGTTQYLTTGVSPGSGYSMIIRFASYTGNGYIAGHFKTAQNTRFDIRPQNTINQVRYGYGSASREVGPNLASGVLAVAGPTGYRNGVSDGSGGGSWSGTADTVWIGARSLDGAINTPASVVIAAFAVYSGTLTLADVQAITAAMNVLPAAGLLPSMLQHAAMGWR